MALTKVVYELKLDVEETPAVSVDTYADPKVVHKIADHQKVSTTELTLTTTSTPAANVVWGDELTLTAGSLTIDLTALDQGNLPDINLDGKAVILFKIVADPDNTAVIIIKVGATNGYFLFGDANGQVTLDRGEGIILFAKEKLPLVSTTVKNIDVTSGDNDAKFKILLVGG